MPFQIITEKLLDKRIKENPKTLGEHLLKHRLLSKLFQKDMAKKIGCTIEAYGNWEGDKVSPLPRFYPAIIKELGYLPLEDLSTYNGVLKSERLRRGLQMIHISRMAGANPAAWTRWERGIYVPAYEFVENLKKIGIDLSHFELHGDIVPTPLAKALRAARKKNKLSHEKASHTIGYRSVAAWHRFELQGVVPPKEVWSKIEALVGIRVSNYDENGYLKA